jgi:hypothetical protein
MKKPRTTEVESGSELLEKIKGAALVAMVSDDELMDILVLKGGNALNLVHKLSTRNSMDLDFSMEKDFFDGQMDKLQRTFQRVLDKSFSTLHLKVFDVVFMKKPEELPDELKSFWGGYRLEYKLIEVEKYGENEQNIQELRKYAIRAAGKQKFEIEFSPFEFVATKSAVQFNDYTVHVYSPLMIVCEKMRAICQQTDEYGVVINRQKPKPRPRDFYDIYYIVKKLQVDLFSSASLEIVRQMFAVKHVPLSILNILEKYRSLHKEDEQALYATLKTDSEMLDFDDYFNFVLPLARKLYLALGSPVP